MTFSTSFQSFHLKVETGGRRTFVIKRDELLS